MVTLVESSAAATHPFVEPRKKAETVPVVAGLAHKTWVQDWPPLVVLQMALSLNTQSLVKNTAPAFCAQPISRSIMWMESNSGAAGSCAGFGIVIISPRATFEHPSKTLLNSAIGNPRLTHVTGICFFTADWMVGAQWAWDKLNAEACVQSAPDGLLLAGVNRFQQVEVKLWNYKR